MSPAAFRVGDIVDVSFSFVVVKVKNSQHTLLTVLRSLTLLDDKFTKVSATMRSIKIPYSTFPGSLRQASHVSRSYQEEG